MNLGWLFAWAKDNNITEPRDGSGRINVRKLLDMYGPAEVAFVRQTLRVRREQARRTGHEGNAYSCFRLHAANAAARTGMILRKNKGTIYRG